MLNAVNLQQKYRRRIWKPFNLATSKCQNVKIKWLKVKCFSLNENLMEIRFLKGKASSAIWWETFNTENVNSFFTRCVMTLAQKTLLARSKAIGMTEKSDKANVMMPIVMPPVRSVTQQQQRLRHGIFSRRTNVTPQQKMFSQMNSVPVTLILHRWKKYFRSWSCC